MAILLDYMLATLRLLGGLRTGLASAGNTTSLTDTARRLEDDDYFNGGTIWIIEADGVIPENEFSLITDFGTGVFTFNALTAAVEAGDRYAASEGKYPYDMLMDAVNQAMAQYRLPRYDVSLTVIADQTEYKLPDVIMHGYLKEVYIQTNVDADDNQYQQIGEWWTLDTGTAQLVIIPSGLETGKKLRLDYEFIHTYLDDGKDAIQEMLEPKYVIYRAAEFMLLQQMNDGDEWPYLENRMNYFIDKADRYEAEFLERIKQHRRE